MEFTKKVLENGMTLLHEKRDVPVTTVMLAVKYGAAFELEEDKGVSHFLEHLCFKGTPTRSAREIVAELEHLGGKPNAFTGDELTAYFVKLPSNHLNNAMNVIFDIYFNATFPEEEFQKESQVILEEKKMHDDNPMRLAFEEIKLKMFKKPFGISIIGTEESIKNVTRDKVKKIRDEMYTPKNSILCVVGNNSFEEVEKLALELTPSKDENTPTLPSIEKISEEGEIKKDMLHQSNLVIGFHLPFSTQKERLSGELFSTVLGSGMASRLFTEVREKRGLVYSVRSSLDSGKNYNILMIWAGCDPSKAEEVKKICLEEFYKMENVTEEELKKAKEQLLGGEKIESEDSGDVAIKLVLEEINGDANNYYNLEEQIKEITVEDLKKITEIKDHSFFQVGP